MQVAQGNFFYHSNSRLGADGGLKDERQLLIEEQKLCRSRARRFSQETNRRRRALEERQRQWDVQEQRLIESVLKQRRQRVQDATERFQRAHLPPSQRRRQPFRRNVPNIEDALNQIQGSLSSYTRQSSFLSSNSNISRNCTPSPKPPTVPKSSHRQALSAVEAYTKLLQEQSMTCFKSSQQSEKQQDGNAQDSRLSDCCNSESLSSKDSLENEDPSHKHLQSSCSSFCLDSEMLGPDQRKQSDSHPRSDLTSVSAMMLFVDNLPQSRKLHEPKQIKQGDSERPNNERHVSKASWEFTPVEQTPKTETQPALHNHLLTLCDIISAEPEHFEVNSSQNSPSDNISVRNSSTALECSRPKQEAVLDDRHLKHPSATEILLPAKNGNSKDMLFRTLLEPNIILNNSTTREGSLQQTGKEKRNLSSQKEPGASINNLNKVSNLEPKTEKPSNAASLQHTCLSNIHSDALKCLKCPEEEVQKMPFSERTPHSVCGVTFIKGILKKQSKYMSADAACLYGAGHLLFAKQVALAIRDSVELTRTKGKDVEGDKMVKKKLRWFDEVHVEKEDKQQNVVKQMKGKSSSLSHSNDNSEDHQLSLTAVSGASRPGPGVTPPASAGYHFTKQAWADVGVQVSLQQDRVDEVKASRSSTRSGGPKVPRRERSARAGAGPVSSRARKGTVIRPQSATEVSQIAKTQGRFMAPRPPPRMDSEKMACMAKSPYGADPAVHCKQVVADQANSDSFLSPHTHHAIRTDSTVMQTLLTPSYTRASSGHQDAQGCSRRRGFCSDCTPTEEEISQLWHDVRTALATKDGKAMLRRQTLDVVRKPCVEQSQPPPRSGTRRFPQPSQPLKQTTEPVGLFSSAYSMAFPDEGLASAAKSHLAEVHAGGPQEGAHIVAAMETAQTQRPGTVQQRSQRQELTAISLEEQKLLLSLDRLNQQLHCVRGNMGSNPGTCGLTREVKVTNHQKHCASSANNCSHYQRK